MPNCSNSIPESPNLWHSWAWICCLLCLLTLSQSDLPKQKPTRSLGSRHWLGIKACVGKKRVGQREKPHCQAGPARLRPTWGAPWSTPSRSSHAGQSDRKEPTAPQLGSRPLGALHRGDVGAAILQFNVDNEEMPCVLMMEYSFTKSFHL